MAFKRLAASHVVFFFFQAEDGIRDVAVTGVQTCALPICGNVLALAPRCCVMVAGNPETRTRLRRAGVEVREFGGREICLKGGGGPTCLTRPLVRSPGPR